MIYDTLLLTHILSAMVWVGGGFLVVAVERHSYKAGGRDAFTRTRGELEWVDDWIFTPAPLLAVATGVAMVVISGAWAFSRPWIYLTLGLIAVEFAVGYRDLNRLTAGRQEGTDSPEYKTAVKTWLRFAPTAIALYGVIVALMLFKPGVRGVQTWFGVRCPRRSGHSHTRPTRRRVEHIGVSELAHQSPRSGRPGRGRWCIITGPAFEARVPT